jgi:hypothetical protein
MLTLQLSEKDIRSILYTLRIRQDERKNVPPESPVYATFLTMDTEIEKLKMRIVSQVPSIR